jgi:hypothetical protein
MAGRTVGHDLVLAHEERWFPALWTDVFRTNASSDGEQLLMRAVRPPVLPM